MYAINSARRTDNPEPATKSPVIANSPSCPAARLHTEYVDDLTRPFQRHLRRTGRRTLRSHRQGITQEGHQRLVEGARRFRERHVSEAGQDDFPGAGNARGHFLRHFR